MHFTVVLMVVSIRRKRKKKKEKLYPIVEYPKLQTSGIEKQNLVKNHLKQLN